MGRFRHRRLRAETQAAGGPEAESAATKRRPAGGPDLRFGRIHSIMQA